MRYTWLEGLYIRIEGRKLGDIPRRLMGGYCIRVISVVFQCRWNNKKMT